MAKELVHSFEGDLPEGWATATLGDLISPEGVFIDGDWVESKDQDPNGDVRLIQLADIADGYYKDKSERFLTKEKALKLNCTFLKKGDVLIARMPDPLGRACIFPGDAKESVTVVDVCVVRTGTDDVNHKWLMYWVNSPRFRNTIASLQSGTTRKRISRGNLATITFPVPPSEQQKRIVAKIEELFSHIDAGIEALKKAKQLLKQYRQSVLKAAVTGKLTEQWRADRAAELDAQGSANAAGGRKPGAATKEWREENKDKLEPASQLLERILKERRQKWEEQQLEQFKAKGKMPKNDKWKEKYQELVLPDDSELSEIPSEWAWVNWETILSNEDGAFKRGPFGSALKKSFFVESGYKVYEQYCPINDDCSYARYYINDKKFEELKAFEVKAGDFLISCSGTLGRITQVPDDYEEGVINQALLRVRVNKNFMDEQYFKMLFRSPYFQGQILDNVAGVAIQNVKGVKDLKEIPVPLPSINEQLVIYEIVNEKTSAIDRIESEIDVQLKKAERNKQSVLATAFKGSL